MIEAGEEVRIAVTNSQSKSQTHRIVYLLFLCQKDRLSSLYSLFKVTINYLAMAEEGGEVREVRQKYLRCVINWIFVNRLFFF